MFKNVSYEYSVFYQVGTCSCLVTFTCGHLFITYLHYTIVGCQKIYSALLYQLFYQVFILSTKFKHQQTIHVNQVIDVHKTIPHPEWPWVMWTWCIIQYSVHWLHGYLMFQSRRHSEQQAHRYQTWNTIYRCVVTVYQMNNEMKRILVRLVVHCKLIKCSLRSFSAYSVSQFDIVVIFYYKVWGIEGSSRRNRLKISLPPNI